MIDQQAIDTAVYQALTGHAGLAALIQTNPEGTAPGVYHGGIPQEAELPCVLCDFVPASDVTPQGERQMSGGTLLARAVVKSPAYPWTIAEQIDAALHGLTVIVGGYLVRAYRAAPFRLQQPTDGVTFSQAGGNYEILVSHPLDS